MESLPLRTTRVRGLMVMTWPLQGQDEGSIPSVPMSVSGKIALTLKMVWILIKAVVVMGLIAKQKLKRCVLTLG